MELQKEEGILKCRSGCNVGDNKHEQILRKGLENIQKQDLFTSGAEDEIFKVSAGIPRMINRICEKTLMYAYQQQRRLIDEHMVRFVADQEMVGGIE